MPSGLGQSFLTQPLVAQVTFANADGTTAKALVAAPSAYWRIVAINVTSDDTAAQVIRIFTRLSSTNYLLGSLSIPAGAGTAGAAPKEFFGDIMPANENGLDMGNSNGLQASMEAAITSGKTVTVTVFYGFY